MAKGGGGGGRTSGGEGAGGVFRALLTVALVCLVGYNTYEMWQLKAELQALRHDRASKAAASPVEESESFPQGDELLRSARSEVARAEQFLHLKRYEDARDQLTAAAQTFQQANASTRAEGEKVLAQLRGAAKQLSQHEDSAPKSAAGSAAKRGTGEN